MRQFYRQLLLRTMLLFKLEVANTTCINAKRTVVKRLFFVVLIQFSISGFCQSPPFEIKTTFSSQSELQKALPNFQIGNLVLNKNSFLVANGKKPTGRMVNTASLPTNLNSFIFSPSGDHFVAYEETEVQTKEIFFYLADGSLLGRQMVNVYPNVSYSSDGEHVVVFNNFGRQVFVFKKNGLLLLETDYINLTNNNSEVLYKVLVSETAGEILINAGDNLYLIDARSKAQKFHVKAGRVLDGAFFSSKGKVAIQTISSDDRKFDLQVLSTSNGRVEGTLPRISKANFLKTGFIVFNDSKIVEYEVK